MPRTWKSSESAIISTAMDTTIQVKILPPPLISTFKCLITRKLGCALKDLRLTGVVLTLGIAGVVHLVVAKEVRHPGRGVGTAARLDGQLVAVSMHLDHIGDLTTCALQRVEWTHSYGHNHVALLGDAEAGVHHGVPILGPAAAGLPGSRSLCSPGCIVGIPVKR